MKFTHVMALAIMAATGGVGAAEAQSLHAGSQSVGVSASPDDAWVDPCTTRVVLRRIAKSQAEAARGVYIPSGYKKVWEDDRLSLRRTQQTFAGKAQMEQLWTNTVPRDQIKRSRGRAYTGYAIRCAQY